jgi:hypothetical protein
MKQAKRVLALIGVVLLVLLYLSTLVFALLGRDFFQWMVISVIATIVVPVLIWMYGFVYRIIKNRKS